MNKEQILAELYKYGYSEEDIKNNEVVITAITAINEDAQLVRFLFNKFDPCVAIAYNDGAVFTPWDWQSHEWEDEEWRIEDTKWRDVNARECIMLSGLPRMIG